MYKSSNKSCRNRRKYRRITYWMIKNTYLVIMAFMIGFSNAYLNETRMVNDIRNFILQEQIINDEEEEEDKFNNENFIMQVQIQHDKDMSH